MTNNSDDNIKETVKQQYQEKKREEKQLYGYFRLQIGDIAFIMSWTWLGMEYLKRELECLLIMP